MRKRTLCFTALLCATVVATGAWPAGAGDIDPPLGPVLPTMIRLDQIEPRTPISSLPFTINQCGSYFLTDCLTGGVGQNGITIDADDVTLDLNGFTLLGVPGSLDGIAVGAGRKDISITNGTVRGWSGDGVDAASSNNQFTKLQFSANGNNGLSVGSGSTVIDCVATQNGSAGISVDSGTKLSGCSVFDNDLNGIVVGAGCYVIGNNCRDNGLGVGGKAIWVTGDDNRIEGNHVSLSGLGIDVAGAGNLIIKNSATGNATDYAIAAGNTFGPILNVAGGGDLAVIPGADHPWANFGLTCTPAVEVCDGLDNDCNGMIDDGVQQSCGSDVGQCESGIQTCEQGQFGDCVGQIGPQPEVCDLLDNDCNGIVDENLQQVCGSEVGECREGIQVCVQGQFGACIGEVLPQPEVCDGLDNDCNGIADDGLQLACGSDVGQCQTGIQVCEQGQFGPCIGEAGPQPEQCDNLDNDCNGIVDDGVSGEGDACNTGLPGICSAGVLSCQGGMFVCNQIQSPSAEQCDGLDNDCDGTVDNNACGAGEICCGANCVNPSTDPNHCGACAVLCGLSQTCESGQCTSCFDGTQNGNETDTDCGGGVCTGCPFGANCLSGADCISEICQFGECN